MNFSLSAEQDELVASFNSLLGKECPIERVRAAEPGGFDHRLWRTLVETGVLTMSVPEHRGGWGASVLDLALISELFGRALAPVPALETQVAARLLAATGSPAALAALAPVLDGERIVTIGLHPVESDVANLVPAGAVCDVVVVLEGNSLGLVEVAPQCKQPVVNLANAPFADITREAGRTTELLCGDRAAHLFSSAVDEWMILVAAAIVGASAAAHEEVCRYSAERRAFGSVVGSYQGVAHPLADDATAIDGARLLNHKAAWACDVREPRSQELAAMAFAFACETAERATYNAIHFHGGYGFMLEHDVQLYFRRVRGWTRVWGGADEAYRRAAAARYLGAD